mmetsp:Transcript_3428/g.7152  ORF Transcript_3428/g.7152 Transcript_3428/m.7152 type:complete len:1382 (+) Transcript_3428:267-4412(+)
MLTATISSPLPPQQQLSPDDTAYPAAAYSESSSDDNLKQNDHVENDHINHTDEEEKDEITTKALQINNNEGALHDVDNINEDQPARQSSSINEETSSTTSDKNLPSMTETQDAHKQRTRRANVATIQDDASTSFSPYQPTPSLEAMNSNVPMRYPKKKKKKSKKRRGKLNQNENNNNTKQAKSGQKATAVADINEVDTIETSSTKPQHLSDTLTSISNDDRDGMLQNVNDPILQHYLPKLTFLNDNFYTKVKPYGIGRRNLPQNQIELILRRRAVKKKKDDNHKGDAAAAAAATGHKRPPLSTTPTTRRKVFPSTQQHFDDDSTISSATAASTWTAGSKTQHSRDTTSSPPNTTTNHDSSEYPTQQYSSSEPSLIAPLPQEEIVGDTSLGLKLTILQGKVIIQAIDSLNDGRASPAQLCGLISPGDILIAVNGKSLINGTIHNPAPMDRIISVLQPLSQPMDETSGEYSREVRLRLVLGEGMDLLREQKQREDKKREDMERRKALGFDRQNSGGGDAAGDIFGIASFMAVDQHSGMPLFGHLDHPQHHVSKAASTPKRQTTAVTDNRVDSIERNEQKVIRSLPTPQTLQEQIARQVALDRQWIRNRNTSEFFSLNNDASVMLRPPTPPPTIDQIDTFLDPIEARKQMLARGEKVMNNAKSLLTLAEFQDRRVESFYADEDPMEVASRVCGTASIRTGASKRRWHRGDSAVAEEDESTSSDAEDASEESAEECDHRRLIDLAANDDSWKVNVLKRLELYAQDTEKESNGETTTPTPLEKKDVPTSFDAFLFGGDVTTLMRKKKQSLALPPGEMTAMLFDLVDHLSTDFLPGQIFLDNESGAASKSVSFSKNLNGSGDDTKMATEFLLNDALRIWLNTFRPLPWTQRQALWRKQSGGPADASMAASTLDDNMSLSMASGSIGTTKTTSIEREKRNLREVIEEMELDAETRIETCRLVTFYFTRKCALRKGEEHLATLIDTHGSYLDLHQCLVAAGKVHSKLLIEKLLQVAKNDSRHRESMKHLKNADENKLIFYEPQMLSALLEMLSSLSTSSGGFNPTTLLVSAYPDLQPWCVKEMSSVENANSFYFKYMSSLLHHEEGNDAARRDRELVKEWCLMLSSQENTDEDWKRECFLHIASRDDESSILYHRDLPFLMDTCTKMSEFGLALDIANEIVQSIRYRHNKQVLEDVLKHLETISDVAVKGNDGELNATLLSQIITFFNVIAPCLEKHQYEIDIIAELTKLLEQCRTEKTKNTSYASTNVGACITCISENAPPSKSLQVFSQWEHSSIESASLVSAIQTSLIRGAREGLRSELSGSLLRIKRAREEGLMPMMMENEMTNWDSVGSIVTDGSGEEEEEDEEAGGGGFIWKRVLDGTLQIAK